MDTKIDAKSLLKEAKKARKNAYTPFSGFAVGAALLTKSGKVYLGCNIESSVMSPSLCAERVALAKALSDGERKDPCFPCGVCRQVLSEHTGTGAFEVIVEDNGKVLTFTLGELLPKAFVFEKDQ